MYYYLTRKVLEINMMNIQNGICIKLLIIQDYKMFIQNGKIQINRLYLKMVKN